MKTSSVVVMVVMAHVVTVGMFFMVQGCGTPRELPSSVTPAKAVMPKRSAIALPPSIGRKPDTPEPSLPRLAETTTYIVRAGDSLSVIAQRFSVSSDAIVSLNNLENPDKLSIGQSLLLPGNVDVSAPPAKPLASEKPTRKPEPGDNMYVVQPGDSLSEIAEKEGTTVSALREANGLSGDKILVDQKLIIPPTSGSGVKPMSDVNEMEKSAAGEQHDAFEDATELGTVDTTGSDAPKAPTSIRSYTVQEGEDLYSVSLMWAVSADELKSVNNLTGKELTPGQVLKIPMTP